MTRVVRGVVAGATAAGVVLLIAYGPGEAEVIAQSSAWRAAARENLAAAVAVFVAVETVVLALSVPVGVTLTVLAGFLFGAAVGTLAVSVASSAGAVLAFLAARYLFAAPLRRYAASRPRVLGGLERVDRGFAEHGAFYVLLLRLTPVVPFWLVNLGLALTPVRLRTFWLATQLGMLPITVVMAATGAELGEVTSLREVLTLKLVGLLMILPLTALAGRWVMRRWAVTRPASRISQ